MILLRDIYYKLSSRLQTVRFGLFAIICHRTSNFNPNEYSPEFWYNYINILHIESTVVKLDMVCDLNGNMKEGPISGIRLQPDFYRHFGVEIITYDRDNIYNDNKLYIISLHDYNSKDEEFQFDSYRLAHPYINVISFNACGVGMLPGTYQDPEDYKAAIRSIIDNLHTNGIPYENMVILGHGLSAAMGLVVVAEYQKKNQRIKIFADRTFANLADFAADNAANIVYDFFIDIPVVRTISSFLTYYSVNLIIRIFRLNIDAAEAFTIINNLNCGDARGLFVYNDQEISEQFSLARSLNKELLLYIKEFECNIKFSAHDASLRDLNQYGAPFLNRNSGEFYLNECIDNFKVYNFNKTELLNVTQQHASTNSPVILYAKGLYYSARNKIYSNYTAVFGSKNQKIRLEKMYL